MPFPDNSLDGYDTSSITKFLFSPSPSPAKLQQQMAQQQSEDRDKPGPSVFSQALGNAGREFLSQNSEAGQDTRVRRLNRADSLIQHMNYGVQTMPQNQSDISGKNSPKKTDPAATTNPEEVEARWMARLAKFAGISQATGVKLGSS